MSEFVSLIDVFNAVHQDFTMNSILNSKIKTLLVLLINKNNNKQYKVKSKMKNSTLLRSFLL